MKLKKYIKYMLDKFGLQPYLKPYYYKIKYNANHIPRNAIIELSALCNAKCPFCPRNYMNKELNFKRFITLDKLRFIIYELKKYNIKNVRLYAIGEPSLHPNFEEIIELLKDNGFIIDISTNGINLKKYRHAFSLVDNLQLSIEGWDKKSYEYYRYPLKFEIIYDNLKSFYEYIAKFSKRPTIYSHLLLTKQIGLKEIVYYLNLWGDYVDKIIVDFMFPANYFDEEEQRFKYKFNEVLKDKYFSFEKKEVDFKFCSYPFDYITIGVDGKIGLCCSDFSYKLNLGYIDEGIKSVVNNPLRKKIQDEFIKQKLNICKGCHIFLDVKICEKEKILNIFNQIEHKHKDKLILRIK